MSFLVKNQLLNKDKLSIANFFKFVYILKKCKLYLPKIYVFFIVLLLFLILNYKHFLLI